jgi:hypothetical protein
LIKTTNIGKSLILTILLVELFGLILRDIFLVIVGVIGIVFIIYEYQQLSKVKGMVDNVTISPSNLSITGVAGESIIRRVKINSNAEYTLTPVLQYLNPKRIDLKKGDNYVDFVYSPVIAGIKQLKEMWLEASDKYRLFSSNMPLSTNYTFTIYPRVFPLAVQAMNYLSRMSTYDNSSIFSPFRGSGTEYAETREYQPGDSLKRFDWKAYAKTTTPMVKDYFLDEGGGVSIIYDNASDNPISLDELNHMFLKTVLSLVDQEEKIQIRKLTEEGWINYELDRFNTLLLSIKVALEGKIEEFIQYYTLLNLKKPSNNFIVSVIDETVLPSTLGREYTNIIVISSMLRNPITLLQFIEQSDAQKIYLINPTKTWVWQKNLEKTYQSYNYNLKISAELQKRGVKIFTSHDKLVNSI